MKKQIDKNLNFVEQIINIISLENGLSKNTKSAYISDINLIFNWFKENNINPLKAQEPNFMELFSFLHNRILKQLH